MLVRVVRHGRAAAKEGWLGDDAERPLDARGRGQAAALRHLLADQPVYRLRSSPTRRCVDTLTPLADARQLDVARLIELAPEAPATELARLLTEDAEDGDLVCAHGEHMAAVLRRLRADGVVVDPDPGDEALLAKGTCWELTIDEGHIRRLRHVRPLDA